MSNKFRDMSTKNHKCYFSNNIINIKDFDPNNIKINEKSYKNIPIYYIGYVMVKDPKYIKTNSVNLLYLMFTKVNRYF